MATSSLVPCQIVERNKINQLDVIIKLISLESLFFFHNTLSYA